jgi:hypothetical protein
VLVEDKHEMDVFRDEVPEHGLENEVDGLFIDSCLL